MKKSSKRAFRKGFTLVELMIVIVILGVLFAGLIPRVTGARSRAQDLTEKAAIQDIAAAASTYMFENGLAWGTAGTITCLDDTAPFASDLKGGIMPTPQGNVGGCTGQYAYGPLTVNGVSGGGFFIAADLRVDSNITHLASALDSANYDSGTTLDDIIGLEATSSAIAAAEDSETIYIYAE